MFDIPWGKLVIIGVVALLVIGPKELPAVLRQLGQYMTKIRRMAAEFQGQFQEAMREAEMAELKQHFDTIQDAAKDIGSFDPVGSARKDIENAAAEKPPDAVSPASPAPASVPEPTPAELPTPVPSAAAAPELPQPVPARAGDAAAAISPAPPDA